MICDIRQVPKLNKAAIFTTMSKSNLQERIIRAGKSQTELAKHLGISEFSASRLALGKRKMSVEESQLINEFIGDYGTHAKPENIIPVYGYAHDWENDELIALTPNRAIEWIDKPKHQWASGEVFAIRTLGETMEPRLFAGEEIYIAKDLPPARGKDCVIEFKDGTAVVKTYEKQKDGFIWARQYNPDSIVKYASSIVKQIHSVIART